MLLVLNFLIGFVVAGIDWRAHLGGAIVGAMVAAVMAYAPKQSRTLWQILGVLAISGLLVVAMMLRTAQIQTEIQSELLNGRGQLMSGSTQQR